jgi:hypothetical protein
VQQQDEERIQGNLVMQNLLPEAEQAETKGLEQVCRVWRTHEEGI